MKSLLLMRHAKSSWSNASLSDHDRPLNERGLIDAPRMGRLLRDEELVPDVIISSTARRAADTAGAVALSAGYEGDIRYTRDLYHGEPEDYLEVLIGLDEQVERVMLVGHNPGMEELVTELAGHNERMPTAALAYFRLAAESWKEAALPNQFEYVAVWRPKEL